MYRTSSSVLTRDKLQEDNRMVYRWYDGEKGEIVSVVQGDFPDEVEIRVSGKDFDSFIVRGKKDLVLEKSDKEIEELVNRQQVRKGI